MTLDIEVPWVARFKPYLDRKQLKILLDHRPEALCELHRMSPHEATIHLEGAFKALFVATDARVDIAMYLVRAMDAWSRQNYGTRRDFVRCLYEGVPALESVQLITLTGLAGVGKSALVQRLLDVLPKGLEVVVNHEPGRFPMMWGLRVPVGAKGSIARFLRALLLPGEPWHRRGIDGLIEEVRRRAYRSGVSLIVPDELQFLTKSRQAHAQITTLLYSVMELGFPTLAVMNFSLSHRLLKGRNQEDLDRFFSRVLLLDTEPVDSRTWLESVQARVDIAPNAFNFRVKDVARELYEYTYGIDRYLNSLLMLAYQRQRAHGMLFVTISDIKSAYLSPQFASSREHVVALFRLKIGRSGSGHEHLINPFPDLGETANDQAEVNQEIACSQAAEQEMRDLVKQNLTHAERQALKKQERAARKAEIDGANDKVVPISKGRPKASAASAASLSAFLDSMKKKDPS